MNQLPPAVVPIADTDAESMRIAREAEAVASARASARAGRLVDSAKVKAWIDSLGSPYAAPVPRSDS